MYGERPFAVSVGSCRAGERMLAGVTETVAVIDICGVGVLDEYEVVVRNGCKNDRREINQLAEPS